MHSRQRVVTATAMLLALTLVAGCSDEDIERTIGKQTSAAIESSYHVVDDPLLADYINTMGHILVGHSRRQDIPYDFKVLETDIVNAAAVPWGYVYLTTGLLEFVESEDELWAITGHEIGHQVGHDSVKAVKESILLSLATVIIGRETALGGDIAELGFDILQLKHSREAEYEADDHGTEVMFAAGYDPVAQTRFFDRLKSEFEKRRPSRLETLFLTHPPSDARIRRQFDKPELALDSVDSLTQIGAGYARRARYAEAIAKLSAAAEADPSAVQARLLLAKCHMARGEREDAARVYAEAVKLDPASHAAQAGVEAAKPTAPSEPDVSTTPDAASAAHEEIERATGDAEESGGRILAAAAGLDKELKPATRAMERGADTLVGVGQRSAGAPEPARRLALEAGIAITQAGECVYAIERMGAVGIDSADSLKRSLARARDLDATELSPAEVEILSRSAREARRCAVDLDAVVATLPSLARTARNAGRVAQTATVRLSSAMTPVSSITERQIAVDTIKLSNQRASEAREDARREAERAVLARTRSLTVEINIGALALGKIRAEAIDDLVAYYTQSDPATVQAVRVDSGLGHGETAVILAAAKSSQRPPETVVASSGEGLDIVDAAESSGGRLQYVNMFLKFIADALAHEAAAS